MSETKAAKAKRIKAAQQRHPERTPVLCALCGNELYRLADHDLAEAVAGGEITEDGGAYTGGRCNDCSIEEHRAGILRRAGVTRG